MKSFIFKYFIIVLFSLYTCSVYSQKIGDNADYVNQLILRNTNDNNRIDTDGKRLPFLTFHNAKYFDGKVIEVDQCFQDKFMMPFNINISFCDKYIMQNEKLAFILTEYVNISYKQLKEAYDNEVSRLNNLHKISEYYFTDDYSHFYKIYLSPSGKATKEYKKTALEKFTTEIKQQINLGITEYSKISELQNKAELGDAQAKYELGEYYASSHTGDFETNASLAFHWYLESANLGYSKALYKCGLSYDIGLGTNRDSLKAFNMIYQAAEQGYTEAQEKISDFYIEGYGTEKNLEKAFYWLKESVGLGENKFLLKQLKLARMYHEGTGTSKDLQKALYWYSLGAEKADFSIKSTIGDMYFEGEGTSKNYQKAFYWYSKISTYNFPEIHYRLGVMYYKGEGTQINRKQAIYWLKKASSNGSKEAKKFLTDNNIR